MYVYVQGTFLCAGIIINCCFINVIEGCFWEITFTLQLEYDLMEILTSNEYR